MKARFTNIIMEKNTVKKAAGNPSSGGRGPILNIAMIIPKINNIIAPWNNPFAKNVHEMYLLCSSGVMRY